GFKLVDGSWNIMDISFPRISFICLFDKVNKSWPSNITFPPLISPGGLGIKRNKEVAVTLFPEPDSPTIPTFSFLFKEKPTPLTAFVTMDPDRNWTFRSSTFNNGSDNGFRLLLLNFHFRIEGIP